MIKKDERNLKKKKERNLKKKKACAQDRFLNEYRNIDCKKTGERVY